MTQQAIDSLAAQLDATKQMFNEAMNSNLVLRTQCIVLAKTANDANARVEALTKELADANIKIASLENPAGCAVPDAA